MAEDDDDETFGEFAFASFQSNPQFNGPRSLADNEDDEWGDFVIFPHQSKPSDPSFKGNSGSPPHWVKPSGALPLSIFGDAEEHEEIDNFGRSVDVNQGENSGIAGDFNSTLVHNVVSSNRNRSIVDLYNRYSEIKPENGPSPISTGCADLVENEVYSSSNHNGLKIVDLNDTAGVIDSSQLKEKSDDDEFSFKSYVPDPSENANLFGGWSQEFIGFSSNLNTAPNVQLSGSDFNMSGKKEQFDSFATTNDDDGGDDDDDGDDGWEFKDANSEFRSEGVNKKVDLMAHEVSERSTHSPGIGSGSNYPLNLFETQNGSMSFFSMPTESVDYFANSSGISGTSQEVDFIGIQPSIATLDGFTSETSSAIKQNNIEGLFNHGTDDGSSEFDENFGEFTVASAATGPKSGEGPSSGILFPLEEAVSTLNDTIQEKDTDLNYHKGTILHSIFGNEKPESGGSSDVQDLFMLQSISDQRNSHTPTTAISINDLISSLYSEAEQTSFINTVQEPIKTQLSLSNAVSNSNIINGDLDDDSWDFKDASQTIVYSEESISSTGDSYTSISSKLKLNNHLDFYSKLKEELCFVTKSHIESLKQARGNAVVSGDDTRAASLDSEFQLVCKELGQMNFLLEDDNPQDHPTGDSYLNEFVQVLLEPQFQILDSEYHLSQKLLLVKKDLRPAMELIRHTTTMLKILTIGTTEEKSAYISIWSEMISACAQELKHGASIWNQAMEKHLQCQLLSEPQGRKFVLALGEIYRVVVVLGASAKLFKPWTFSGPLDSPAIYILLEESHAVWSSSGLEEALSSVSAPIAFDNTSLFKSIKHILDLDALTLQNYVFAERESLCRLSILTAGVAPGMKMITWGNEQCFVTLANLWANLISRDPPKLPQLNLG